MKWTRLTKYEEAIEMMNKLAAIPSSDRLDAEESEISPETEQDTYPNVIQQEVILFNRETGPERKTEASFKYNTADTEHHVHNFARDESASLPLIQQKPLIPLRSTRMH